MSSAVLGQRIKAQPQEWRPRIQTGWLARPWALSILAVTVVTATGVFLMGCEAHDPLEPPPKPIALLSIGSAPPSGVGFVGITDGDSVELIPGSQGGFHLWTTLRVKGASGELFLGREARLVGDNNNDNDNDGTLVLLALDQYMNIPKDALTDWWERTEAIPSFMCPAPIGVRIFDTELAITAQLKNSDGTILAEDRVVVRPQCPSGDQQVFCQRVCDG